VDGLSYPKSAHDSIPEVATLIEHLQHQCGAVYPTLRRGDASKRLVALRSTKGDTLSLPNVRLRPRSSDCQLSILYISAQAWSRICVVGILVNDKLRRSTNTCKSEVEEPGHRQAECATL